MKPWVAAVALVAFAVFAATGDGLPLQEWKNNAHELVELGEAAAPAPKAAAKPAAKTAAAKPVAKATKKAPETKADGKKEAAKPASKDGAKPSASAAKGKDVPLKDAKGACEAAWTETKRQCGLIRNSAAQGKADVKAAVEKAGADIKKAIEDSIKAKKGVAQPGDAKKAAAAKPAAKDETKKPAAKKDAAKADAAKKDAAKKDAAKPAAKKSSAMRVGLRARVAFLEEANGAGSGVGLDATVVARTIAHTACQNFWKGVETACQKFDTAASSGRSTLEAAIATTAGKFLEDAKSALAKPLAAAAAAPKGSGAGTKEAPKPAAKKPAAKKAAAETTKKAAAKKSAT